MGIELRDRERGSDFFCRFEDESAASSARAKLKGEMVRSAETFAYRKLIEQEMPPDIREMAERHKIPALAESVWTNGFQKGFELALLWAREGGEAEPATSEKPRSA